MGVGVYGIGRDPILISDGILTWITRENLCHLSQASSKILIKINVYCVTFC